MTALDILRTLRGSLATLLQMQPEDSAPYSLEDIAQTPRQTIAS